MFFMDKLQSQEKFITGTEKCHQEYSAEFSYPADQRKFCADDQDHSVGKRLSYEMIHIPLH